MAKGDTKTNQYLDIAANGTRADLPTDTCCETRTQTLIRGVAERIMDVEDEVEEIKNNPDVVDVVPTYAALQNYDTSSLTDKDIIRVLQDETHDGDSTYYRYNAQSGTWTYVGESKQYEDFVGTDGTAGGQNGLVPAPVATDAGKFLNANGSWEEVQAGPTVVQTTGTSTTDVMSQNAVTSMVFANPGTNTQIRIGSTGNVSNSAISIGTSSQVTGMNAVALGSDTLVTHRGSVALGSSAQTTVKGQIMVGTVNTYDGYNSTNYRLVSGVHEPQSDHDAATKGYVDPTTDSSAPTTATVGRLGQIQIDTTTATAYMCVAADDATPSYTWKQITA